MTYFKGDRSQSAATRTEKQLVGTTGEYEGPSESTKKILLVDDDEGVLNLCSLVLRETGYTVITASGAYEALELYNKEGGGFDMLISDIDLPDFNGVDLAGRLVAGHPELQVLLITGRHWVYDTAVTFKIMNKPFHLADFLQHVRRTLYPHVN